MTQARIEHEGRTLYAWKVKAHTVGRSRWLRTWAETAEEAKAKAIRQGFTVSEVKPYLVKVSVK